MRRLPFELHSVRLLPREPGTRLRLRDYHDGSFLDEAPEWMSDARRNEPVAFVRGSQAEVEVVFRQRGEDCSGTWTLGALGEALGCESSTVDLHFERDGLSLPLRLPLTGALPEDVGCHELALAWHAGSFHHEEAPRLIGVSRLNLLTTFAPQPGEQDWAWLPLVEWGCAWAQGLEAPREICDRLLVELRDSEQLELGRPAWSPRAVLREGGGMPRGLATLFAALCAAQGIGLHTRFFTLESRRLARGEMRWNALVFTETGIGREVPAEDEQTWYDNEQRFPIGEGERVTLQQPRDRRWRFWTHPELARADGHVINFLWDDEGLVLYDPAFGRGGIALNMPLPPARATRWGGHSIASFREAYLDRSMEYVMGSVFNGPSLVAARAPSPDRPRRNGMTVRTSLIHELDEREELLTVVWGR